MEEKIATLYAEVQRCYICKTISNTALAAHVYSHTAEECFLIIQRSLQCCVELTPVEIRSPSKQEIHNEKCCIAHMCAVQEAAASSLVMKSWWLFFFSQWKILAVTQACFNGVVESWEDLRLNLKFYSFFLLVVTVWLYLWILQVGLSRYDRVCPSLRKMEKMEYID